MSRLGTSPARRVLITGGAGFIGANLADRLAAHGNSVILFDNLSRAGVENNAAWLKAKYGSRIQLEQADVRDARQLLQAVSAVDQVFHFAAQVAVTSSITDPRYDFEVNLGGTLNLLEAIRSQDQPPSLVFTSTNKVYGSLKDVQLEQIGKRYLPADEKMRQGVSETQALEFQSPYGCSKGSADQYVLDYARSFDLQAVVFRMSCIYGPHQMGTEDQGWIAHFLQKAINDETITIYGDGYQVRDVLYIEDLVDALIATQDNLPSLAGEAFNIGGGCGNAISILELIDLIDSLQHTTTKTRADQWRVGDQRYYVSNTAKFRRATGWTPQVNVRSGLMNLYKWLLTQREASTVAGKGSRHAVLTN